MQAGLGGAFVRRKAGLESSGNQYSFLGSCMLRTRL